MIKLATIAQLAFANLKTHAQLTTFSFDRGFGDPLYPRPFGVDLASGVNLAGFDGSGRGGFVFAARGLGCKSEAMSLLMNVTSYRASSAVQERSCINSNTVDINARSACWASKMVGGRKPDSWSSFFDICWMNFM